MYHPHLKFIENRPRTFRKKKLFAEALGEMKGTEIREEKGGRGRKRERMRAIKATNRYVRT